MLKTYLNSNLRIFVLVLIHMPTPIQAHCAQVAGVQVPKHHHARWMQYELIKCLQEFAKDCAGEDRMMGVRQLRALS